MTPARQTEIATLGGGCFWCIEAVLEQLKGVESVTSGYSGGQLPSPTYRDVCNGNTGHAEVVRVEFDPTQISFREILEVFFATHDPTTLNRQGADVGTQYRSVIFYHNEEQLAIARQIIAELTEEQVFPRPIVTQLAPAEKFHVAEDYHQGYFRDNPMQPYCQAVIHPKLAKFRQHFAGKLKP